MQSPSLGDAKAGGRQCGARRRGSSSIVNSLSYAPRVYMGSRRGVVGRERLPQKRGIGKRLRALLALALESRAPQQSGSSSGGGALSSRSTSSAEKNGANSAASAPTESKTFGLASGGWGAFIAPFSHRNRRRASRGAPPWRSARIAASRQPSAIRVFGHVFVEEALSLFFGKFRQQICRRGCRHVVEHRRRKVRGWWRRGGNIGYVHGTLLGVAVCRQRPRSSARIEAGKRGLLVLGCAADSETWWHENPCCSPALAARLHRLSGAMSRGPSCLRCIGAADRARRGRNACGSSAASIRARAKGGMEAR